MFTKLIKYIATSAFFAFSTAALAEDNPAYIIPSEDGAGFSIDYDALNADTSMTDVQKSYLHSALLASPDFQTQELFGFAGIDVTCEHQDWYTTEDCKLTISKDATSNLAALGALPLAGALCAPITAESGEVLQIICAPLLGLIAANTIKPAMEACVKKSKGIKMELKFSLVHHKASASSHCQ